MVNAIDSIDDGEDEDKSSKCSANVYDPDTMMRSNNDNDDDDDEVRQQERRRSNNISTVEIAATNVLTVLRKYTADPSSLPLSLNPADIITTYDNDTEIKSWEIRKSSPWYNMSEAFHDIIMAREGLVKAWKTTKKTTTKMRNKVGDECNESHSCWNGSEGGGQRRKRTQQIDGLNMVDGNNLDDDNDGEGDDGWWQSIIPLASRNTSNVNTTTTTTARENNCVTTTTPIDNDLFIDVNDDDNNNKMVPLTEDEQRAFATAHLEYTTAIFGDELDAVRQGKLEEYCTTKSKNKESSLSRKEANNAEDIAVIKNVSVYVELDPTHYSFVVPTSKGKREQGGGGGLTSATTIGAVASNIDVRMLSNMLHSWNDVHTLTEERMILGARQKAQEQQQHQQQQQQIIPRGASSESLITPHARQKRKVGFLSINDIKIQRN